MLNLPFPMQGLIVVTTAPALRAPKKAITNWGMLGKKTATRSPFSNAQICKGISELIRKQIQFGIRNFVFAICDSCFFGETLCSLAQNRMKRNLWVFKCLGTSDGQCLNHGLSSVLNDQLEPSKLTVLFLGSITTAVPVAEKSIIPF